MKKPAFLFVPLILALAGFACDSDDDKVSPAKAKCTALADAYCSKVITCKRFTGTRDSCMNMFSGSVMCDKATAVSDSYDSCLSAMTGASCAVVTLTPPDICKGVIVRPAETGGTKK